MTNKEESMPQSPASVSIIIPVHGSKEFLRKCLKGLAAQDVLPFEIIVSIDGDDQELAALAHDFGAKTIESPCRQGAAIARNRGAAMATGEILLFIDSDVVCPPTVVKVVKYAFAEDDKLAAIFGSYDNTPAVPNFFSQYRNLLHHYVHQNSSTQARTFWTGCGAIRRDVFESLGGFNERYHSPAVQDIELGYHLSEAGHKISLCKTIQVQHLKQWTLYSTLRTDIFTRSLSWSRLLIESKGRYINDLNMNIASRVSIAISFLLVASFFTNIMGLHHVPMRSILIIAWFYLNRDLLQFYMRIKGLWFTIRVVPALWLYYISGGLGYIIAWIEWALKQVKSPHKP